MTASEFLRMYPSQMQWLGNDTLGMQISDPWNLDPNQAAMLGWTQVGNGQWQQGSTGKTVNAPAAASTAPPPPALPPAPVAPTAPPSVPPNLPSVPMQPLPSTPTIPTTPVQSQPPQGVLPPTAQPPQGQGSPSPLPGFPTSLPGGVPPVSTQTPGQTPGLPINVAGLPAPDMVQTPQLPTILGLTTPSTPINQATVQNTDISPFIPTTSQQQQDVVSQAIQQSQGLSGQGVQGLNSTVNSLLSGIIPQEMNVASGGTQAIGNLYQNAIPQDQQLISQAIPQIQDMLTKQYGALGDYYSPSGKGGQQLMGQYNNLGILNSGAFNDSLATNLAQGGESAIANATSQYLLPSLQDLQSLPGQGASAQSNFLSPSLLGIEGQLSAGLTPSINMLGQGQTNQQNLVSQGAQDQSTLGLSSLQRFIDQANFGQQSTLANQLADKGQPSSAQKAVGMGSSILGGLGSLGQGIGAVSWICGHLKKINLATEKEIEDVHEHLYPSIFRHPIHWLHYLYCAPRLIALADAASVDWKPIKEVLIDSVLSEPDPEKAWQIYRTECQRLTIQYAPELWVLEVVA